MKSNPWRGLVPLLLACLVAGCGGAGSESASTNTNSAISALSAPANFDFATFGTHAVTANGLLNAVGGFTTADAAKAYVKVWYVNSSGQRNQLAFMSLAALQGLGSGGISVQAPADIRSLSFEIYDARTNKTGEVKV